MNNITQRPRPTPAILQLGFRPLFFVAGLSGLVLMVLWVFFYRGTLTVANTSATDWHAHGMIFGYAAAVVVGFLLTASKNWSGIQTLYGKPLLLLLSIWVLGRFLPFVGSQYLPIQAVVDVSFLLLSTLAIAHPIVKAKLWDNTIIIAIMLLFSAAHFIYYLGLLHLIENGQRYGLYLGFYAVIYLLLFMSRRLLPFFIARGLDLDTQPKNSNFIDSLATIVFFVFMCTEVFWPSTYSKALAGLLFSLHAVRAFWWYNKNIWTTPLLWSIHSAYCFMIIGFGIKCLSIFVPVFPNIDTHAFAFGLGLMTLALMSRVTLGHTGRSIKQPPKAINFAFILLVASFVFRVIMPIIMIEHYYYWVLSAQILWIIAFALFLWLYAPMLFKKRIDDLFG